MENNWPETIGELLGECYRLISKNDLYTLGERGEPFSGETEPRVDGTEYLAGEYQYGVAMIPAQWVTHVLEVATLGGGKLTAKQIEKAIHDCSTYASYDGLKYYADGIRLQAIADELNVAMGNGTCKNEAKSWGEFECSECGFYADFGSDLHRVRLCPDCGKAVER